MIKVGITGGIGSGKSTVCELLAGWGIPVYNSDLRARTLVDGDDYPQDDPRSEPQSNSADHPKAALQNAIINLLGTNAYTNGKLDRKYVADRVFADKILLARLNAIIHPAVIEDFEAWAAAFERNHNPDPNLHTSENPDTPLYIVLESAILFESGFDRLVDKIVTVSAPESVRLERAMSRAKKTQTQAKTPTPSQSQNQTTSNTNSVTDTTTPPISREELLQRMSNQLSDPERERRADYIIDNGGTLADLTRRTRSLHELLKKLPKQP